MTGFHLDLVVIIAMVLLASWDGLRRFLQDRAQTRVAESEALRVAAEARISEATELGPKVEKMLEFLSARQKVSEQALGQFISQAQELVGNLEAKRVEAEKKALRQGFQR